MMRMFRTDKIIDIIGEVRKIVRKKFNLVSNFPQRAFSGDESENLEELGFYPSENLHIQIIQ